MAMRPILQVLLEVQLSCDSARKAKVIIIKGRVRLQLGACYLR